MVEVWRTPPEHEIVASENATERQINTFFTKEAADDVQAYWKGLEHSTRPLFLQTAKVTMAAQNLTDLNTFVKRELSQYQKGGLFNRIPLFTAPETFDMEAVREVLESKPLATNAATIPQDNHQAVQFGKYLLQNLTHLGDPEKSYSQIQREATRDLAMFRHILGGPGTTVRANMKARYMVFSYLSGLAMQAFEPDVPGSRREMVALPTLPPRPTVTAEPIQIMAAPAPKSLGTIGSVLDAIDLVAPPLAKRK